MTKKIDISNNEMWQSLDWDEKEVHPELKRTDAQVNKARGNRLKAENPNFIAIMAEIKSSTEYKEAISKTITENWQDPTFRKKNSEGKKRNWANNIDRKKQVVDQFSQPKTDTHKKHMSESQKAFYKTDEGKKALLQKAEKQKGKKRKTEKCPHCGKEGGEGIMKRWHFDKCKLKK